MSVLGPLRVAIYVRVSSKVTEQKQSQLPQFQALRAYAAGRGWKITHVYRDRASGVKDRPALRRCLHDAAMNRFGAVLVWALDRFGRTAEEVLGRVRGLRERNVGFASYMEAAIDTTTAAGELILGVFAVVAAFERRRLSERTKEGLAVVRRRGQRLGRPRLGYDLEAAAARVRAGEPLAAVARSIVIPRRKGPARPLSDRALRRHLRGIGVSGSTQPGAAAPHNGRADT